MDSATARGMTVLIILTVRWSHPREIEFTRSLPKQPQLSVAITDCATARGMTDKVG